MKIYTGGGDKGKTSLFSGERVAKHHVRIETYGDLDELSSIVGVVASSLPENQDTIREDLLQIQSQLFSAGAWLATTPDSTAAAHLLPITDAAARNLEQRIDAISETLPLLRSFILPGGQAVAAWAHVARTVCRRCERQMTRLIEEIGEESAELALIQVYLNRLSDYLFVVARSLNHVLGTPDIIWKQK